MHFFIDHTQLTDQTATGDGFGPSSADPTNKYAVSANFQLATDAKAFACQPGQIIVTDFFDMAVGALDPDLVNVLLKPSAGLGVTFPTAKYYIYRGVRRDSFFTAGAFNAEAAGNTDTVRKMWQDWHANVASSPDPIAPSDLGFDATLPGATRIEEAFAGTLVTLAGVAVRPRQVIEGEWIATFGSAHKIAFEVIVEAELLSLDLDYARASTVQIDISAMTAIAVPTPAQTHTLRCEKEKVLAYVDPAALFGMHFSVGVSGTGLASAAKRDTLVSTLLTHFSTATRVYLDIRSDKGYSYNFYDNYGGGAANLIRIKPGAAAATVDDVYFNQGWPLFSQAGWTGSANTINARLQLRIDDNTKPLLFVEDAARLGPGAKNFLDETKLLDGPAVDWSKPFNLKLDGSGPAGAKVCVAIHVRLQYLKQNAVAPVNPRLLQFNHRLDTVYGGIDLPIATAVGPFGELRNEKVGLAQGAGFAYIPDTGVFFDADVVLLRAASRVAHRTNPDSYPPLDFAISTLDNVVRSPIFPSDIVFSRWSVVEAGVTIPIIELSSFKQGVRNTSIDGVYFLGLTRDELARLQAAPGFGPLHQRFLTFEEDADQFDDHGVPYKKYQVKVQGLDSAGQRLLVAPNPIVEVFGAGANMFCSLAFANTVSLPDVPPDPGLRKQWEHVFAGTYGFGDPDVTAISAGGRITVDDLANNMQASKPNVRLKARYFFPVDAAGDTTISTRNATYPLVVIVHGNGHLFTEYDALGRHLAHNGFIVASINLLMIFVSGRLIPAGPPNLFVHIGGVIVLLYDDAAHTVQVNTGTGLVAQPWVMGVDFDVTFVAGVPDRITVLRNNPDVQGMAIQGRANVLFRHLEILKHKFGATVADNIGLIGHSRGGEAVVRAADLIGASSAPADLRAIRAIISIAPTDLWEVEELTQDIPYFVLYGSRDGDVSGGRVPNRAHSPAPAIPAGSGGFSLYDRAVNSTVKSMSFVYFATHNGFITTNKDFTAGGVIAPVTQRRITLAYMNGFLRRHLLEEPIWDSYLTGQFIPGSTGYKKIFQQYKDMTPGTSQIVDNFENVPHNFAVSSLLQAVTHSRGGAGLAEGLLNLNAPLDVDSPHETSGLKITDWHPADTLTFTVSAAGLDVTPWTHVSFRIGQVARKTNSTINTLRVALQDANGPPGRHEVVLPTSVPDPDFRPDDASLTKSALMTVRIPLSEYQTNGVDLTKLQAVELVFPAAGNGNIEIDDLEFTK